MVPMKARLFSLLNRLNGTGRHTTAHQDNQVPRPDPAVVAKFRELDRAGCSVDEILAALRNTRTAGTSR